jgi:hypothetical protein
MQVEDLIMVPTKEAKGLLYNLLSEKFINLQVKTYTVYTPENDRLFELDKNRMQQYCDPHIVIICQRYCSALLHLIVG